MPLSDEERKRRRREASILTGLLLFDPRKALRHQQKAAEGAVLGYLEDVGSLLNEGEGIGVAVQVVENIEKPLTALISSSIVRGFQDGAKHSGKAMPSLYGRESRVRASKRAAKAVKSMKKTTRKRIKAGSMDDVLSPARAERVAMYESRQAYYLGVMDAFEGEKEWGKEWISTSGEPCEDCLDNEDEGLIPVEDEFQSGDDAPPLHLNCQCYLAIRLLLE
jgi:hypothetical protein